LLYPLFSLFSTAPLSDGFQVYFKGGFAVVFGFFCCGFFVVVLRAFWSFSLSFSGLFLLFFSFFVAFLFPPLKDEKEGFFFPNPLFLAFFRGFFYLLSFCRFRNVNFFRGFF
jgi:hypothetical protein